MDRNQSWFHGTTAGVIHHFKDPLNASLRSDQSPEYKKIDVRILGLCTSYPLKNSKNGNDDFSCRLEATQCENKWQT